MTDLILAIVHHLLIFMLLAVLVIELTLTREGMSPAGLQRLTRIDLSYGILAGVIIVVGVLRVHFGLKGAAYYLHNIFFWLKMAAFLGVGLLSVPPTLTFLKWKKAAAADAAWLPGGDEIARVRKWLLWELRLFALIPVFAAIMARYPGYMAF
jgi:putative membrane protein